MTREEAIHFAVCLKNNWTIDFNDMEEFCDMAIEALKILGDDGIVNCCGCIHWKTDGGAMMMCELWDTPMGDFDYCSYGKREGGDMASLREEVEKTINTVIHQPTPKEYVFIIGGMVFKGKSEKEAWNNFVEWATKGGGDE